MTTGSALFCHKDIYTTSPCTVLHLLSVSEMGRSPAETRVSVGGHDGTQEHSQRTPCSYPLRWKLSPVPPLPSSWYTVRRKKKREVRYSRGIFRLWAGGGGVCWSQIINTTAKKSTWTSPNIFPLWKPHLQLYSSHEQTRWSQKVYPEVMNTGPGTLLDTKK